MSYDKRTVRSWVLYDFANSIFPAVVTTAVFPQFYVNVVVTDGGGVGDLWWTRAVSLSALVVAFTSPLLGAIADRSGVRKKLFAFYVAVCLTGVGLMTTLEPGMLLAGFFFFVIANVGFESAAVFYNAYLPDIAPPERLGEVSGRGFGWGYLGSALGLLLVLPFGMREQFEPIWVVVVAFFIVFSIPAFRVLPADGPGQMPVARAAVTGITELRAIIAEVWRIPNLRRFLFAYFFYIDGVLSIIAMAGIIAVGTFGFTTQGVIILFLIVQFSAMAGALTMARPTDRLGPKKVLTGVLMMCGGGRHRGVFHPGADRLLRAGDRGRHRPGNGAVREPGVHGVSDSRRQGGADVRFLRPLREVFIRTRPAPLRDGRLRGRREPAPRFPAAHPASSSSDSCCSSG